MATVRDVFVFAHLPGEENRFVPAGRLTLTEILSPNPAERKLASAFAYGTRYIERPESFELDPVSLSLKDRSAVRGRMLYPVNALPEFGGLRDAAPDAWGRRVIEARRKVPANTLPEADYLLEAGSDRVGALDVREALDMQARPSASDMRSLGYLLQAADAVEAGVPVPAQLMDILGAGSTAGGARPKASVRDEEGGLWLAKFPSRHDTFDFARAELCTLELARSCGLTVPEVRHCDLGGRSVMRHPTLRPFLGRARSGSIRRCPSRYPSRESTFRVAHSFRQWTDHGGMFRIRVPRQELCRPGACHSQPCSPRTHRPR